MKLKYDFVLNEISDQKVAIASGESAKEFNGFIKLNDTGASIFEKLKNDISKEELIEAMAKEYPDETNETVINCVNDFVDKLVEAGLVE